MQSVPRFLATSPHANAKYRNQGKSIQSVEFTPISLQQPISLLRLVRLWKFLVNLTLIIYSAISFSVKTQPISVCYKQIMIEIIVLFIRIYENIQLIELRLTSFFSSSLLKLL